MAIFGWLSDARQLPPSWDLRRFGWQLCEAACSSLDAPPGYSDAGCVEGRHVLLVDAAPLKPGERLRLAEALRPCWRLLMLGVEDAARRAELIGAGCGDALPTATELTELDARARRVVELLHSLPRWRQAGPLVLDMVHRDGRLGSRWLGLHPREFGLLWRLAQQPGVRVTRRQLLQDVWRLDREPETNSLEVHVSRLRAKLARLGCAALIKTVPQGGYCIDAETGREEIVANGARIQFGMFTP